MVFVVPAYRLGLFGWLDVGQELEDAPYNVGMQGKFILSLLYCSLHIVLDLLLALKWVQKEGLRFGGNVNKIVAMGNSGGGSAVEMLMASPALKPNTFDKVIISSGMVKFGPHQGLVVTQMVSKRLNVNQLFRVELLVFNF